MLPLLHPAHGKITGFRVYVTLLNFALFRLAFATALCLKHLTLQRNVTRRPVLQKVRGQPHKGLPLLVSIQFQILFHSPPGVLFTFPSRYYTLSVNWSYLALGDGPPAFTPDFTCPVLLWILLGALQFRLRDCHPILSTFQGKFVYRQAILNAVLTLSRLPLKVWALPRSLATTNGIVVLLSFPLLTKMFRFSRFPSTQL